MAYLSDYMTLITVRPALRGPFISVTASCEAACCKQATCWTQMSLHTHTHTHTNAHTHTHARTEIYLLTQTHLHTVTVRLPVTTMVIHSEVQINTLDSAGYEHTVYLHRTHRNTTSGFLREQDGIPHIIHTVTKEP